MKTKSLFVLFVFLLSTILSACAGSTEKISGSFAGKVDGSDAFISIVVHTNGEVTAYVCDSVTISEWFSGSADGSSLDLTNGNGAHLSADLSADSVQGTFTPAGGSALTFTTSAVTHPAGLYRGEDTVDGVDLVAGWIVLPDGDQRGAVRGGGLQQPAPILNPATSIAKGSNWPSSNPPPYVDPAHGPNN